MKLLLLVSAVLLSVLYSEVLSAPGAVDVPYSCCFKYTSKKIPRSQVQAAFVTSSQCSKPAVIFITKLGREVCGDPEKTWVQDYLRHFKAN